MSKVWRAVAATAGACLLVTLVGWAALIGPSHVFTGPGPIPSSVTTTTSEAPVEIVDDLTRDDIEEQEHGTAAIVIANVIGWAIQLLAVAAMVLAVLLVVRRARRAWHLRRRFETPGSKDFETLEEGHPDRVRTAMATDAQEQLTLLRQGSPRNAIVACWHRFEVQAVEAGVARHAWETSSEFVLRMLDLAEIDPAPVGRLTELYREARFSEHDLGEADRAAAEAALLEIQARIGVRRIAGSA